MHPIDSTQAAIVCGVGAAHLKKLARAIGLRPVRLPRDRLGRGIKFGWGARHLLALLVVSPLRQVGVGDADAIAFARGIAELPSDEALEAVVRDRPFALAVAPYLCPYLLDAEAVRVAGEAGGAELMLQGRQLTAIHLGDLHADLVARMRAAAGVTDAAP